MLGWHLGGIVLCWHLGGIGIGVSTLVVQAKHLSGVTFWRLVGFLSYFKKWSLWIVHIVEG